MQEKKLHFFLYYCTYSFKIIVHIFTYVKDKIKSYRYLFMLQKIHTMKQKEKYCFEINFRDTVANKTLDT